VLSVTDRRRAAVWGLSLPLLTVVIVAVS